MMGNKSVPNWIQSAKDTKSNACDYRVLCGGFCAVLGTACAVSGAAGAGIPFFSPDPLSRPVLTPDPLSRGPHPPHPYPPTFGAYPTGLALIIRFLSGLKPYASGHRNHSPPSCVESINQVMEILETV